MRRRGLLAADLSLYFVGDEVSIGWRVISVIESALQSMDETKGNDVLEHWLSIKIAG